MPGAPPPFRRRLRAARCALCGALGLAAIAGAARPAAAQIVAGAPVGEGAVGVGDGTARNGFVTDAPGSGSPFGPFVRLDTLGGIRTRLDRDGGRYRSEIALARVFAAGPWRLFADIRGASDAFEGFQRRLSFRDELGHRIAATRPLTARTRIGVASAGEVFAQSRVVSQTLHATLDARPGADLALRAALGGALDARPGARTGGLSPDGSLAAAPLRRDAGPAVRLDARFARDTPGGALVAAATADGAACGPRRRADLRAVAEGHIGGADDARPRLDGRLRIARVRRDAYQAASFLNRDGTMPAAAASEAVEATTADTLDAAAAAALPLARGLRLDLDAAAAFVARRVRVDGAAPGVLVFDTDVSGERLDGGAFVTWMPGAGRPSSDVRRLSSQTEARVGGRVAAGRERRLLANAADLPPDQATQKSDLLEQADFDRGDLAVEARVRHVRRRLTLTADAQQSIARLDTPERNADDRDEARTAVAAVADVRLREGLSVGAEVVGSGVHTVYLKAARSAESQQQRVVRLRPYLDVATARTRLRLTTEVRAAYTRDDVRLTSADPSDASAREWRLESHLWHALSDRTRLSATATASDLRLGRLVPDRFAEVPTDTVRTLALDVSAESGRRVRAAFGVRVFARSDFDRSVALRVGTGDAAETVVLPGRNLLAKIGPTTRLDIPLPSVRALLRLDGWWAWQRTWTALDGGLDAPVRAAARRGTTRLLPLVRLDTVWRW